MSTACKVEESHIYLPAQRENSIDLIKLMAREKETITPIQLWQMFVPF